MSGDYGPAVLPDGLLADWYKRALRADHRQVSYPVAHCRKDRANWPCGAIRALSALEAAEEKLARVRELAEAMGDRSSEPVPPAQLVKVHLPMSDRRIVAPIQRLLLEILDGEAP